MGWNVHGVSKKDSDGISKKDSDQLIHRLFRVTSFTGQRRNTSSSSVIRKMLRPDLTRTVASGKVFQSNFAVLGNPFWKRNSPTGAARENFLVFEFCSASSRIINIISVLKPFWLKPFLAQAQVVSCLLVVNGVELVLIQFCVDGVELVLSQF